MKRSSRWTLLMCCTLVAVWGLDRFAPPRWLPWTRLDLQEPPGIWTPLKLTMLSANPAACRAALARADIAFDPVPDQHTGRSCGYANSVRLISPVVPLQPRAPNMSCPLAAALSMWQRHVVAPAAVRHLGETVTRIEHYGTYSCRNIAGTGRRSEHATANAIDIAAFRLESGTRLTVQKGWRGTARQQAFLLDVHAGGCALFSTALGPAYNAAHADHLHFDMGLAAVCR